MPLVSSIYSMGPSAYKWNPPRSAPVFHQRTGGAKIVLDKTPQDLSEIAKGGNRTLTGGVRFEVKNLRKVKK